MAGSASTLSLDGDFMRAFSITKVHWAKTGGQKEVYLIDKGGKQCILKLFKRFGKREIRELDIYRKFAHIDGLPKIILEEEYNGDKVIFEQIIEGNSMDEIVQRYTEDYPSIKSLIVNIATLLEPIWDYGTTHRDLKPANIIIRPNGTPAVIDFGIARIEGDSSLTATGFMPRTINFCAPEQYRGDKSQISYRTDYFNLGIIAYYLYYQKFPFGSTEAEITAQFDSGNLDYHTTEDCPLNEFFELTLPYNVAERARDTELLLKSLP